MSDYRPTHLACYCGEESELDDDWQPGDIMPCDYCGALHILAAVDQIIAPTPREVDQESAQLAITLHRIFSTVPKKESSTP
jgi:hypothetical protein